MSQALPSKIPAASQGTMNNVTIGSREIVKNTGQAFAYYETIAGGMGALPNKNGASGVHSHMTNTLNTPIEALEYAYPLRIICYELRKDSGGKGKFKGGDGIRRDIQVLAGAQVTLLSDRRKISPYGLNEGHSGDTGENLIIHNNKEEKVPSKCTFYLDPGDILSIRTPGGGGFGNPSSSD
jgi:N-methylhydantoinase B